MIKLLQVSTVSLTLRQFLAPIAQHFRQRGWRVDAMAAGVQACPRCTASFDHCWDVPFSRNPGDLIRAHHLVRQIRTIVARERYDLVHVHTPIAAFLVRYALRGLRGAEGPRVLYTAHGFHFHEHGRSLHNGFFLACEKLAGRWTDYLVVINEEDERAARRHRLVPEERLVYVPGVGIDRDAYAPQAVDAGRVGAVRRALGLAPADVLFLMVAEFNPGKRHLDALRAFAALGRPEAHLALAGVGPLEPAMARAAAALGIEDRVHFLGWREDVPALIRAARATLLPSEREGLPRGVMESLCLEVPVIGTHIRGLRALVPPTCGVTVEVGDLAGLTAAMRLLMDDPAAAAAMGRAGRQHMAAYDLQRVIALHETLYERACRRLPVIPRPEAAALIAV